MKNQGAILLAVVAALSSGCASIVNGQNQSVSVDTRYQGNQVSGANCQLSNNKGTWYVTSPGTTTVQRSYEDIAVKCEKEGTPSGMVTAKSSTKAMAFGNILFGGIIGAGIDVANGAAFDYPNMITVHLGDVITLTAPPAKEPQEPSANVLVPGPLSEVKLETR